MRSGRVVNRCKVFCVCALVLWVFLRGFCVPLFYGARAQRARAAGPRATRDTRLHRFLCIYISNPRFHTSHRIEARAHCSITLGTGRIGSVALYLLLIPGAVW